MAGTLEGIEATVKEIHDSIVKAPPPSIGSNIIQFHGSAGLSVLSIIAIVAASVLTVVAVSALVVAMIWHRSDMRELEQHRSDIKRLEAYRVQHGDRIVKLEGTGK